MEGVIVTTTEKRIDMDFNDLVGFSIMNKASLPIPHVISLRLYENDNYIEIRISETAVWRVSNVASVDFLKVKSVDGVEPTSLNHLYEMLRNVF